MNAGTLIFRFRFSAFVSLFSLLVGLTLTIAWGIMGQDGKAMAALILAIGGSALGSQTARWADEDLKEIACQYFGLGLLDPRDRRISQRAIWEHLLHKYGKIQPEEMDNPKSPTVMHAKDAERIAKFFNLLPAIACRWR